MARPRKVKPHPEPTTAASTGETRVAKFMDIMDGPSPYPAPDTRYAKWRGYTVIRQNLRALLAEAESKGDTALADEAKAALA